MWKGIGVSNDVNMSLAKQLQKKFGDNALGRNETNDRAQFIDDRRSGQASAGTKTNNVAVAQMSFWSIVHCQLPLRIDVSRV